jgi:hypothetical protein
VHPLSPAPLAKLFELDLASDEFFIFGAPIVNALAFVALELDKPLL